MGVRVKICGLTTPDTVTAAIEGGADYIGFVFHPPSPRHVDIEVAAYLANYIPPRLKICALFVDPTEANLSPVLSACRVDMIQLHGVETPDRVAAIRAATGKDVIKALPIVTPEDVARIRSYEDVCDWVLLDRPGGGTGEAFDWALLDDFSCAKPWMLAGGLTPDNVGDALRRLKPDAVDVSSGVESARGVKDPAKIREFLKAVKEF
jgi:phosphoribosylanthranilate isomerase